MASILDQKEEVLKVELTKHGRKLLGLGRLMPEYYSFFDDTVIYDLKYAGLTEDRNSTKTRILDESLTLSALNLVKDTTKIAPLGTSPNDIDYAPAWNLSVLKGNISYIQESSSYHENYFTASEITYFINLDKKNVSDVPNYNLSTFELEDGRVIDIQEDYILIDLQELNTQDNYENFQLELVTYNPLTSGANGKIEYKLSFLQKQTNIFDNYIYEENELPNRFANIKLTENDANYFFDILVDEEIDQRIIDKANNVIAEEIKPTYSTTFEDTTGTAKEDC